VLVLSIKGTNRYVQFLGGPEHKIHAEASSNEFLKPGDALSPRQLMAPHDLGWLPPEGKDRPDFYLRTVSTAGRKLARLAVRSLTEVLGAESPRQLERTSSVTGPRPRRAPKIPRSRYSKTFPRKPAVAERRAYLHEHEGDWGGHSTGEFVLLTDGCLFRRAASSYTGTVEGKWVTDWRAQPWELETDWEPWADVIAVIHYLTTRGCDLYPATPIPVTASSASLASRPSPESRCTRGSETRAPSTGSRDLVTLQPRRGASSRPQPP
jgi:hypothetical protein